MPAHMNEHTAAVLRTLVVLVVVAVVYVLIVDWDALAAGWKGFVGNL